MPSLDGDLSEIGEIPGFSTTLESPFSKSIDFGSTKVGLPSASFPFVISASFEVLSIDWGILSGSSWIFLKNFP